MLAGSTIPPGGMSMLYKMPGHLLIMILGLSLAACDKPIEGLNEVAEVETGPLGRNALLTEVCLDQRPYYLLVSQTRTGRPGSKGALAIRYARDGGIPACNAHQTPASRPLKVKLTNVTVKPDRQMGTLCLDGILYYFAGTNYTAGMSPVYTPEGRPRSCH